MNSKFSPALKIAFIYFVAGSLWILLSDTIVSALIPQKETIFEIGLVKGIVFVLLTTLLIYLSSKKYINKINKESSERKFTETELRQEKYLLNRVAETSPVAITILDANGQISFANIYAEKLLMLTKDKMQSWNFDSANWKIRDFEGNEFPKEKLPFNQVLKTKQPVFDVKHTIELPSGRKIFLSINASPIFNEEDKSIQAVITVMRDITEAIQYEKRLIEFRITYRGIFDSVKEAIYIHDKNRVIIDVNKRAEELFGFSRAELLGKTYNLFAAYGEKSLEEIEETIDSVFKGKSQKMIFSAKKSDGLKFPVEVNFVKGRYFDSEVLIAVVRDISERVGMEKELRASEQKYRVLFEDNPQPMWVYDLRTLEFIDVNSAAITRYGYSKEEFLSMTLRDIRPPEDVEKVEMYVKKIREKSSTHLDSPIWRHKQKNGHIIHAKVLSHRIELDGKPCRIVLVSDVTEVIKQENALKESEKRYRRIFENIIDVYFETTIEGTILEISPSIKILSLNNYMREELIGKSITELYAEESERANFVSQLIKYGRVDDYELQLKNKDNRIVYCSVTSKLITVGKEQKIIGSLRDITVRKDYEEDLIKAKETAETADRLKSEFLAQMSHEIRTPLNIILNATQLVKDELTDDKQKEYSTLFGIQQSAGTRIIRTIDSILNMSELQLGVYEPQFAKIDLVEQILSGLIDEYKFLAKEKEITIKLNTKVRNVIIWADRYSVTQIFSNLIDNAIKYTKVGKVIVSVKEEEKQIKVDIIDTGIGISNEFIPYLFDAFRQEQQGYSRVYEGNGLGLAIVKKFSEINKAKIKVDSQPGEGSTFTVSFDKLT